MVKAFLNVDLGEIQTTVAAFERNLDNKIVEFSDRYDEVAADVKAATKTIKDLSEQMKALEIVKIEITQEALDKKIEQLNKLNTDLQATVDLAAGMQKELKEDIARIDDFTDAVKMMNKALTSQAMKMVMAFTKAGRS